MANETLPSIPELLNNPASSPWLRTVLQRVIAGQQEPCEAARDARLLAAVLQARATAHVQDELQVLQHSQRPPMLDLLLPLADFDAGDEVAHTGSQPPRANGAGALHFR